MFIRQGRALSSDDFEISHQAAFVTMGGKRRRTLSGPYSFILGSGCYWYDPSSFAIVPLVTDEKGVQRQHRFGNTGRNIALYGPKQSNLDASLFRHFKLSERFDLQFRAEGLNVLNHPAWYWTTDEWGASNYCWGGGPTNNPCGGTFMQATDARTLANSGYDHAHRIIRFGLRLAF